MKIGFYVMGQKGWGALKEFIRAYGVASVSFVASSKDRNIRRDWFDEITELCRVAGIQVFERGTDAFGALPPADFSFAIGWRWMLRSSDALIVFHDSLLPRYRGYAPLVNMLIDGVDEIGVTAFLASSQVDRGDVLRQISTPVAYPLKISAAIDKITPLYADLVVKTAADILSKGRLNGLPQDERLATYSLWRDDKDYFIDWRRDAAEVQRFVDAVGDPYLGAASFLNGNLMRIMDVEPVEDVIVENRGAAIGKVICLQNECPVVVCGRGLLKIITMRREDGGSVSSQVRLRSRFESHT